MKALFAILLIMEGVLLLMALKVVPGLHPDTAVLLLAVNVVFLIVSWKQMKKKRACCE